MKKQLITIAVALLTAGALTTSCSSEDNTIETPQTQQPATNTITLTATLAPKGGASRDQSGTRSGFGEAQPAFGEAKGENDGTTRAITTGTDANSKEILNVAWQKDEQIAIYYEKNNGDYATAMATVGTPNADGSAPITASLTDAKGGTAKFVYPATLANTTGDIDKSKLYSSQKGTLADISANFDAATATGTIAVSGSEASVSGTVSMTNRVCICKFSFTYKYEIGTVLTLNKLNSLTIKSATGDYIVNPVSPATIGDVHLAMLPCSDSNFVFISNASFTVPGEYLGGTGNFMAFPTSVSLTAGKFYRNLPVALTMKALPTGAVWKDLSAGSITANSGDVIWQSNSAATANTITIPDGANATICNVNISASGSAGIICSGDATINLVGSNSVRAMETYYAGIQAGSSGKTLTIQGSGSLTATGGSNGAGIGSVYQGTCGNINISGGAVTAIGGYGAAGIGSGNQGSCGSIIISGGTVSATSGGAGAGIGSGWGASCGSITITTGVTCVTATKDIIISPYSIGKGQDSEFLSTCGTITIGGTVYYDGSIFLNGGDTYLATSPLTYQP